ncbi:MAG: Hpt domain-containing protein [Chitinophagaceae bacterium]|nr:Hpt domain-containing protein [Chitinophagaceae bacterium]MCB9044843.1 Hpt domain-containing protein [Chitinophagales bacterium]
MEEQLVDFDFLEELSGGDSKYKFELLTIFLDTVGEGLANLEKLIKETGDMDAIYKQAHALKSSAGIVKVRDMHGQLARIEELGRANTGESEINSLFDDLMSTYRQAHPLLVGVRDKNKPADA